MAREFLGRGWRFPILPDDSGALGYVDDDVNVEQSLKVLLLTSLGERVMRIDFGTKASRLVFAPGSTQNLRILEETIRDAVRDWEPRVELDEVLAEVDTEDDTRVTVSVDYRVKRTNSRRNLVFPFYLGRLESNV